MIWKGSGGRLNEILDFAWRYRKKTESGYLKTILELKPRIS
jgi:hypothetical protein